MRFNRLDLNLLVALDHMIALRSVSRTAEKMNLSQSAMSNALNRLREFFDDPLLVQVGRNMELTPKARAIQPSLRDIIVRIEAALTSDMSFDPSCSTREFRLIMSDFTMTVLMPHLLSLTSEGNAAVRFRFIPQVEQPDVAIEHGDADVLIAPESLISKHHPYEPLFEDTFVCVAWRHGAYGDGVLTEQDYGRAQHVRMVPPRTTYSFDNQILSELGIERNVDVYCYSFSSLPYLVIGHDRLATVQRSLAEKLAHSLPLTLHPMPMPFPRMRQCIQWHDYKSQDPALTWLRQTLHQAVKRMFALPVPALPVSARTVA